MSVKQAQQDIDSAEFAEWIAFNNIELFTVNRVENMVAIVATILANVNRKKGAAPHSPEDFIPQYEVKKKQTGKTLETKLRAILHGNH